MSLPKKLKRLRNPTTVKQTVADMMTGLTVAQHHAFHFLIKISMDFMKANMDASSVLKVPQEVTLEGPAGIGKTFVTRRWAKYLEMPEFSLDICTELLDQKKLDAIYEAARNNKGNILVRLLRGPNAYARYWVDELKLQLRDITNVFVVTEVSWRTNKELPLKFIPCSFVFPFLSASDETMLTASWDPEVFSAVMKRTPEELRTPRMLQESYVKLYAQLQMEALYGSRKEAVVKARKHK